MVHLQVLRKARQHKHKSIELVLDICSQTQMKIPKFSENEICGPALLDLWRCDLGVLLEPSESEKPRR